jgi:hypothetical protein
LRTKPDHCVFFVESSASAGVSVSGVVVGTAVLRRSKVACRADSPDEQRTVDVEVPCEHGNVVEVINPAVGGAELHHRFELLRDDSLPRVGPQTRRLGSRASAGTRPCSPQA